MSEFIVWQPDQLCCLRVTDVIIRIESRIHMKEGLKNEDSLWIRNY
jgi:hypothetical protein